MASLDPKGAGRLAAQLARELSAAVKAYAAAGGASAGPIVESAAPGDPAADGAAGREDAAAEPPGMTLSRPPQQGSETEPPSFGKLTGGSDRMGHDEPNPYQRAIEQAQARAADLSRRSDIAEADRDFISEVRKLAADLKSLLRRAAAPEADLRATRPADKMELHKAAAEADDAIETAAAELAPGLSLTV